MHAVTVLMYFTDHQSRELPYTLTIEINPKALFPELVQSESSRASKEKGRVDVCNRWYANIVIVRVPKQVAWEINADQYTSFAQNERLVMVYYMIKISPMILIFPTDVGIFPTRCVHS